MTWYGNLTYAIDAKESAKPLPVSCCNGLDCASPLPELLQREDFIDTTKLPLKESDREWIAYCMFQLTKWRTSTSISFWAQFGHKNPAARAESLFMPDECLTALTKNGSELASNIVVNLQEFPLPWQGVDNFVDEPYALLKRTNSSTNSSNNLSTTIFRTERKKLLKAARVSKKLKYIDNPAIAEAAHLTKLRDKWLIQKRKPSPATKLRLKQAAN